MRYWKKLPGSSLWPALLCLLLIPLLSPASEIDVRLAYARAAEGQWLVTTRVDFELDAEAEQLVRQGLRLKVEVEFTAPGHHLQTAGRFCSHALSGVRRRAWPVCSARSFH